MSISRHVARFGLLILLAAPAMPQDRTMFPAVRAMHQMIGAGNPFEVEAGYRILEQGGNAVDAGVAAVLAATVTEQDHIGLGGEMPALIKMAGKPVIAISGIGVAGAKATPDFFAHRQREPWEDATFPPIPGVGIRAAITPGMVDGLLLALEKYGTMPFAKVVEPALEDTTGFPIPEIFSQILTANQRILSFFPHFGEILFSKWDRAQAGPGGSFPGSGAHLARNGRRGEKRPRRSRGQDSSGPRLLL